MTSLSIQPLTVWLPEMGPLAIPTTGVTKLMEFRVMLPYDSKTPWARSSRREAECAVAEASVISALVTPSIPTLQQLELDGEHLPYLHLHTGPVFPELRHIRLLNLTPLLVGSAVLDWFPDAPRLESLEITLHRLYRESQLEVSLASGTKPLSMLFPRLQHICLHNSPISDRLLQLLP